MALAQTMGRCWGSCTTKCLAACLLCLSICFSVTGQTLPETSTSATQCVGQTLSPNCPTSETMIVKDAKRGAKPSSDGCPPSYTDFNSTCCTYASGDCMLPHDSIDTFRGACNGKALCGDTGEVDYAASTGCPAGTNYTAVTNYIQMDYYCINGSRILSMCPANAATFIEPAGKAVYIQNRQYPNPIPKEHTSCSCSVETDKCDGNINIYTVHIALLDNSDCKQTVTVAGEDGSVYTAYTCSNSTGYTVSNETVASTYLSINLQNNATTDGGYVKVGFQASESAASLYINCPSKQKSYCFPTTNTTTEPTTNTTTSTMTSTSASSTPSEETTSWTSTTEGQTDTGNTDFTTTTDSNVSMSDFTSTAMPSNESSPTTTGVGSGGKTEKTPPNDDVGIGVLIGAIVGGFVVIGLAIGLTIMYCKHRDKYPQKGNMSEMSSRKSNIEEGTKGGQPDFHDVPN